jgi:hypothetical protein
MPKSAERVGEEATATALITVTQVRARHTSVAFSADTAGYDHHQLHDFVSMLMESRQGTIL